MYRFFTFLFFLSILYNNSFLQAQPKHAVPFASKYQIATPLSDSTIPKPELLKIWGDSRWTHPTGMIAGDARYAAKDSIIIISGNRYITAWDAATGLLLWEYCFPMKGNSGHMTRSIVVAKDKPWVLAASDGNGIYIFNYYTGQILRELSHNEMFIFGSLSPDGKWAASYTLKAGWKIWNTEKGKVVYEGAEQLKSVSFSPDSKTCAVTKPTDDIYRIQFLNLATGTCKSPEIPIKNLNDCQSLDFSPDGKLLAMGFWGGYFGVYDLEKQQLITHQKIDDNWVDGLTFSPNGKKLLVMGAINIKIWDKAENLLTDWTPTDEISPNNCLEDGCWSKDGKHILLAAREWQRPRRYPVDNPKKELTPSDFFSSTVVSLCFSEDSKVIALTTPNGKDTLSWEIAMDSLPQNIKGYHSKYKSPLYSKKWEGQSANLNNKIVAGTWNADPVEPQSSYSISHEQYFGGVSRDGSLYAGIGNDWNIYVYDAKTGIPLAGVSTPGIMMQAIAISPDANYLVAMGWDNVLRLYKIPKLKL